MQRFLDCILPTFAGIIIGGFIGLFISAIIGSDADATTRLGALIGLPVGIGFGLYFTRKR